METLTAVAADEPDPTRRAGPLQPVLDGLLRKDPAERIDLAETERRLQAAATAVQIPSQREASTVVVSPQPARRPRRILIAAAVAVLALLVGAVLWVALRPGRDDPAGSAAGQTTAGTTAPSATAAIGTASAPASAPAVPPAQSAAASAPAPARTTSTPKPPAAGPTRPPLPAGWRLYTDPTGFSLYVPRGWTKSQTGTIVYFRNSTGRVLGIDQTDQPRWDPVADWRGQADYRVARGDFPGYHEIRIVAVKYWLKAADSRPIKRPPSP